MSLFNQLRLATDPQGSSILEQGDTHYMLSDHRTKAHSRRFQRVVLLITLDNRNAFNSVR